MELKKNYIMTEVGVIPKDWKVMELGEIGFLKNGINKSEENFGFGYPFVNLMDVFGKVKVIKAASFGLINSTKIDREVYDLKKGDVLFIRSSVKPSGVGLTSLIEDNLDNTVYSGFLIRFRDDAKLDFEFKAHCFNEEGFRKRLIGSSTVSANTNINQSSLKKLKIAIPPTQTEQTAIATALSDTDALINRLDKLIAKKRNIKEGVMQKLLKPKHDWKAQDLGSVTRVFSGGTPNTSVSSYYGGNIPWITSGDLNKQRIYEVNGRITDEGLSNSSATIIHPNTLLIALYGATAGVTAISKIKAAINQAVLAIIPDDSVNNHFLFYQLSFLKDWIISTYTQGGQPNLSGNIIKSIEIGFPNIKEQESIAETLNDIDAEITVFEIKLKKIRQMKLAMMQTLLTGKIRLV